MIICLIEFETLPGMESQQQKWLADLMPVVEKMPGFKGKESYAHVSGDGRVNTVSFGKMKMLSRPGPWSRVTRRP